MKRVWIDGRTMLQHEEAAAAKLQTHNDSNQEVHLNGQYWATKAFLLMNMWRDNVRPTGRPITQQSIPTKRPVAVFL